MPTLPSGASTYPEPLLGVSWVDGHKERSRSYKDKRYDKVLQEVAE